MYTQSILLLVAASGASAVQLNGRQSNGGWSLQSSTAVSGLTSCGGGAFCPKSFTCIAASSFVAAACCPTSANCIGAVEGSPSCADPSWSLYKNNHGNGFCCVAGQVGAFDPSSTNAGFCTTSVPSSDTAAVLVTPGNGSGSGSGSGSTSSSDDNSSTSTSDNDNTSTSTSTSTSTGALATGTAPTTKPSGASTGAATKTASGTGSKTTTSSSGLATVSVSAAVNNVISSGFGFLLTGLGLALTL